VKPRAAAAAEIILEKRCRRAARRRRVPCFRGPSEARPFVNLLAGQRKHDCPHELARVNMLSRPGTASDDRFERGRAAKTCHPAGKAV